MRYKKILLALDVSDDEKNVIKEAIDLAGLFGAKITALHINDPSAGKPTMMMDSLPLKKESDVRDLLLKLGFEKESEKINIVIKESENYPAEIAKAAKNADLLIIGHHPKSSFLAAFIDSTDERVSDMVPCPMLVVPL